MASLRDLIAAVTGRPRHSEPTEPPTAVELPHVPTGVELLAAVDRIEADIAAAARVYALARERGLGREIALLD